MRPNTSHTTINASSLLDNPIWNALLSNQSSLSQGDLLARRFPRSIGPLAGMAEQSPETYRSLAKLTEPQDIALLFLEKPSILPSGWLQERSEPIRQMVLEKQVSGKPTPERNIGIRMLGPADVPDMLALTRLTQPGPFREQTHKLGVYFGIRESGHLAAIAGERLRLGSYAEISAVCTHPDSRGKGYAQTLVLALIEHMIARGETPFLHVREDNDSAIRLYDALGFRKRRLLHAVSLRYVGDDV